MCVFQRKIDCGHQQVSWKHLSSPDCLFLSSVCVSECVCVCVCVSEPQSSRELVGIKISDRETRSLF